MFSSLRVLFDAAPIPWCRPLAEIVVKHQLLCLDVQPSRRRVANAKAQPDLVVQVPVASLRGLIAMIHHASCPNVPAVGFAVVGELLADAHHVVWRDGRVDDYSVVVPCVCVLRRIVAHLHHAHKDRVVLHRLASPAIA